MNQSNSSYLPLFQQILSSRAFERLDEFKDPYVWLKLSSEESHLLARLFTLQGEKELSMGDEQRAIKLFERAEKLASRSSDLIAKQGHAFYLYGKQREKSACLHLAKEKFSQLLSVEPEFYQSWQALGNSLIWIAYHEKDTEKFKEALDKLQAAYKIADSQSARMEILWDLGKGLFYLGKCSGEPQDFKEALQKFQDAANGGLDKPLFWLDYGKAVFALSSLTRSAEGYLSSIELCSKSGKHLSGKPELNFCLGSAFHKLYELLSDENLFLKANEYYLNASCSFSPEIKSDEILIAWGELLLLNGQKKQDAALIESALEKFTAAIGKAPYNALAECRAAEALLSLGTCCERLDLFYAAVKKLESALERFLNHPELCCVYGLCLHELGVYFDDEEYYQKAIVQYLYGLSLEKNHPRLLNHLSKSYLALGELKYEIALVEQAVYYASTASKYNHQSAEFLDHWGLTLLKLAEFTSIQDHVERAIEKFERAIRLRGGVEGHPDLEWFYHYGSALDFLADFKGDAKLYKHAIDVLTFVISKNPEHRAARCNLALTHCHLGEMTADTEAYFLALEHFRILIDADPEDEEIWHEWGIALMSLGHLMKEVSYTEQSQIFLEEAEGKLMKAVALGSTPAFYHLGCLYALMGYFEIAIYFIERADRIGSLPPVPELMQDDWLKELRETELFRDFLKQIKKRSKNWPSQDNL